MYYFLQKSPTILLTYQKHKFIILLMEVACMNLMDIDFEHISPYIRYVNNYAPSWSYEELERILYDFELMYVADGCTVVWYNDICYKLNKSDILYMKPGIKNHMIVDKNNGFRTHCIHFDYITPTNKDNFTADEAYLHPILSEERIKHLIKRPIYEPHELCLPTLIKNSSPQIGDMFAECYYSFLQNTPISRIRLKALFLNLIYELASLNCNHYTDNKFHPKVQKAINYIQNHFSEPIKVSALADSLGLSNKYFGTIFLQYTGKSVNKFLMETRLKAARDLLCGSDLSISEIADKTGFGNVYYFSRCFSQNEKVSPTKYRETVLSFSL